MKLEPLCTNRIKACCNRDISRRHIMHSAETITTTILHLGAYSSQRGIRLDDWAHTMTKFQNTFITARCYASAVLAMGLCLSVCLCPSVTSRCSTKTAKRRITQTTNNNTRYHRDSSFLVPKISAKFDRGHPLRGRRMQMGWSKSATFDK